jgi:hypothetical protein
VTPTLLCLAALLAAAPLAQQGHDSVTAFVDVSVIPMDRERVVEHRRWSSAGPDR